MRRTLAALLFLVMLGSAVWVVWTADAPTGSPTARTARPGPRKPRDAGKSVLREVAKATPAGEPVTVELLDPPAEEYAAAKLSSSDAGYAALVSRLGRPGVVYDPALSRAARELAYQQSLLGGLVPQGG